MLTSVSYRTASSTYQLRWPQHFWRTASRNYWNGLHAASTAIWCLTLRVAFNNCLALNHFYLAVVGCTWNFLTQQVPVQQIATLAGCTFNRSGNCGNVILLATTTSSWVEPSPPGKCVPKYLLTNY